MAVPQFTAPPEPGHVVDFGGRRFGFIASEAGRYMGRDYVKLSWSGACKDCGAGFVQSTSLTPRRFATRCSACDPKGVKDAADRQAFVSGGRPKKASRAPDPAIVPPAQDAWRLDNVRLAHGGVVADLHDGQGPDPVEVSWRPGARGFDTPGLNEKLAAEFERLTAQAAALL